jgi:hypothetical protein
MGLVPYAPTPHSGEKGYVGGVDVAGNHTRHERLITRLPGAVSYVFSPYLYLELFFVKHGKIT